MLTIKEAERFARAHRRKAEQGESAIKAMTWLIEHIKPETLKLYTKDASGCCGYTEAVDYLNLALSEVIEDVVKKAKRNVQNDIDRLGPSADDS